MVEHPAGKPGRYRHNCLVRGVVEVPASREWRTPKVPRTREDAQVFVDQLAQEMPADCDWFLGGSWARGAPVIGDLDVAVIRKTGVFQGAPPFAFPDSFRPQRGGAQIYQGDLVLPRARPVVGEVKASDAIHVDFWCVPPAARGAFTMFIVGPKPLNKAQRSWALKHGYNLSQLGLFVKDTKEQVDDGTEEDIYRILEMPWLSWESRQAFAPASDKAKYVFVWDAPSDSSSFTYRVELRGEVYSCRCKSYQYNKDVPQRCKHTDRAKGGKLGAPRLEPARDSEVV